MSSKWTCQQVPIKFQLSDKTLFEHRILVQVREVGLVANNAPTSDPSPPLDPLEENSQGFLVRALPVTARLPTLRKKGKYLRYVQSQYERYYIDLSQSFTEYKLQFKSKTRSTLLRKVAKFAEHSGGDIVWNAYKTPAELAEFFRLVRPLSAKTYQEKLLDAGLPDSENFMSAAQTLAAQGRLRAFILFDGLRPVSYLYCPIQKDVVIYQYLGYDPDYAKFSAGTVLQWLALNHFFDEGAYRLFDFTEGQSEHKRLFSTHSIQCANVFFIRASLMNKVLLQSQISVDTLSIAVGRVLDRWGLKAKVKRLIRFGV